MVLITLLFACSLVGCSNDIVAPSYEKFDVKPTEQININEISDYDTIGGNDFEVN